MNNIDDFLKKNIYPDCTPHDDLNSEILKYARNNLKMKNKMFNSKIAVASLVCVLTMGSVSVYAAYRLLTPAQVANEIQEGSKLQQAFMSDNAVSINESQTIAGYKVSLLGTVTGNGLMDFSKEPLDVKKTYAVVAIENEDGSPMTIDDGAFCITPLINGKSFMELSVGKLNGGLIYFVEDGTLYELLECDNLEIFAEMGVCIGVTKTYGEGTTAFAFDEKTGHHSRNENYEGLNALFNFPLDKSKADNEAAQNYFDELKAADESTAASTEDEGIIFDKETGLPMYTGERAKQSLIEGAKEEVNFWAQVNTCLMTNEQIEKMMSYGTVIEDQTIEEKDGKFKIDISNEYCSLSDEESVENLFEGEPVYAFFGLGTDSLTAEYRLLEDGYLKYKIINYDLKQIQNMYKAFH